MRGGDRQVCVYAFADAGLPPRLRIRGRQLRTLSFGPIAVVIGAAPAARGVTTRALLAQHAIVTELARRSRALLPARFGSLAREGSLQAVVREHAHALRSALDRVRGRVQMTVRVFGPPDASRPQESRGHGGAEYLRSRRRRARHLPPEHAVIRRLMTPLARDEHAQAGDGRLRLTVFHLVGNDDLQPYRERAAALQSQLQPLEVVVTGPWPAFAFSPDLT